MQEFNFSEVTLKKRLRFLFVGFIVALAAAVLVLLLIGHTITRNLLISLAAVTLLIYTIIAKGLPFLTKSMGALKVLAPEDRIVKRFGQNEQGLLWTDITGVKLTKNRKGEVAAIKIYGKNKVMIYLNGLEDMDELARLIFEKTHIIPQ